MLRRLHSIAGLALALLLVAIAATGLGLSVKPALDRSQDPRKEGALAVEDARHVKAQRTRGERDEGKRQADLQPAG